MSLTAERMLVLRVRPTTESHRSGFWNDPCDGVPGAKSTPSEHPLCRILCLLLRSWCIATSIAICTSALASVTPLGRGLAGLVHSFAHPLNSLLLYSKRPTRTLRTAAAGLGPDNAIVHVRYGAGAMQAMCVSHGWSPARACSWHPRLIATLSLWPRDRDRESVTMTMTVRVDGPAQLSIHNEPDRAHCPYRLLYSIRLDDMAHSGTGPT